MRLEARTNQDQRIRLRQPSLLDHDHLVPFWRPLYVADDLPSRQTSSPINILLHKSKLFI